MSLGALLGGHSCKRTRPLRLAAAAFFATPMRKTHEEPNAKHAPDVQDALLQMSPGALLGGHSCKRTKPLRLAAAAVSFAKPTRKTCEEPDAKRAPDVQPAMLLMSMEAFLGAHSSKRMKPLRLAPPAFLYKNHTQDTRGAQCETRIRRLERNA